MRRFSQREGLHTLSEINVTPMLDLCFVLLVIFMITTPLLENSAELTLPSGGISGQPVDPEKVQTLSIDRNEAIKLNGDLVSVDQLTARLETLRRDRPDAAVLIRPHKELSVQKLIAVMDCLQRAKIGKVGIATQQGEGNAP
jgi:biopolymer transport protein ExbD